MGFFCSQAICFVTPARCASPLPPSLSVHPSLSRSLFLSPPLNQKLSKITVPKWPFSAPRTGHISCPFDLVSSRIDSSECPLQNRLLGSSHIFDPTQRLPKRVLKHHDMDQKWVQKCPKRLQKR